MRRGHEIILGLNRSGGAKPREVVVTVTVAVPLLFATEAGLTEHFVALAIIEHDKLTWDEKPSCEETETPLV